MAFAFPAILKPNNSEPEVRGAVRSGGRSVTDSEQVVMGDAGYWEVVVADMALRTPAEVMAWRAARSRLRSGETTLFPVRQKVRAPGSQVAGTTARTAAAQPLRSTSLTIAARGIELSMGAMFSIAGKHLYMITEVLSASGEAEFLAPFLADSTPWNDVTPFGSSQPTVNYSCKIFPPLRAAVANNATLEFRNPTVEVRFSDLRDGDTRLIAGRLSTVSFTLREP